MPFWTIINHPDAVQIKFEIAKGLAIFTTRNTKDVIDRKTRLLEVVKKKEDVEQMTPEERE